MKKAISVFLCLLFTFSLVLPAFAADTSDEELKVTVANDLHYNQTYTSRASVKKHNSLSAAFSHIMSTGLLRYESLAIIEAFLEQASTNDSDFVLLPGDLVDVGTVAEHAVMVALLAEFENTSGKEVYVVPGNHDLYETSLDEFVSLYQAFGYGEALSIDPNSASYTVDLSGDYRLLAIDSTDPGNGPHGMTQERVNWIEEQCKKAQEDGKKLVAMMHHSLLDHYTFTEVVHIGEAVNTDIALADVLASGGVKYIFTGHIHVQDILSFTSADGVTIYDVSTGALTAYPCPYREVTFGDSVTITTKYIESIDFSKVPSGISEEALAVAQNNFTDYTYRAARVGMRMIMTSYIKASVLIELMNLDKEEDADLCAIIEKVAEKLGEAAVMPLYAKDAAEDELSIEAIVAEFGKTIPASDYTDLIDVMVTVYLAYQNGDENYPAYTTEMMIVTKGLAAVLSYSLQDVNSEDYAVVLKLLLGLIDVEIGDELLVFTGSVISNFENLELILATAITPVLTNMSDDTAPADNNVKLPGYAKLVEDELTIWEQIIEFFKKIYNFIMSFLAMAA